MSARNPPLTKVDVHGLLHEESDLESIALSIDDKIDASTDSGNSSSNVSWKEVNIQDGESVPVVLDLIPDFSGHHNVRGLEE